MTERSNAAEQRNMTTRLLGLLGLLNQNATAENQVELGEVQPLLQEITLTDDEANNLQLLLRRINEETGCDEPDWIFKMAKTYLELVEVLGIELTNSKDLVEHHAALAIAMIKLANRIKGTEPRSVLLTMPSTREQNQQMTDTGPGRVKLLAHNIGAELEVLLETVREEYPEANENGTNQGKRVAVSRKVLAQRRLDSLKNAESYQDRLLKIRDAYDKLQSQSDKEGLAISKFAIKAVAALAGAIIVILGWFYRGEKEIVLLQPSQPQQSG